MVLGVRTEDAYGNPRGTGWDGSVLVLSPSPHVSFSARAGVQIRDAREAKVTIKDGVGLFEMVSDSTEIFQITLRDVANTGLRTTSVLRAQFRSLPGVQCIFGEVPAAAQPVGLPFPLPLLVLDRLGNVADDFEGDIPVKMTGACRTAGGAREAFRAIRGRAALPVLSTIAETVQFTLDPATAILNKEEAAASDALLRYGFTTTLTFGAADAKRLTISALAAAAAAERALSGEAAAPGGEVQVRAGDEVLVAIKALDAYNNLVLHQQVRISLPCPASPPASPRPASPPASPPASQPYLSAPLVTSPVHLPCALRAPPSNPSAPSSSRSSCALRWTRRSRTRSRRASHRSVTCSSSPTAKPISACPRASWASSRCASYSHPC